ncbi:hypothetical protein F4776DRAFT_72636 [Hypoxylon sp. NC0597]|nr:hypothetical protein F4776DRAFT_72636 [Hypoxylon sp. NC0597]
MSSPTEVPVADYDSIVMDEPIADNGSVVDDESVADDEYMADNDFLVAYDSDSDYDFNADNDSDDDSDDGSIGNNSSLDVGITMPNLKRKRDDKEGGECLSGAAPSKRQNSGSGRGTRSQLLSLPSPTKSTGTPAASPTTSPTVPSKLDAALKKAIATFHEDKPLPSADPPVWAEVRGALANALPYYKSHQGSLYTKNCIAQGMLVDAEVGSRDRFDSQVIITSVGGGRVVDDKTKKTTRKEDQTEDTCANYTYLAKAKEENNPVVMIAGARNRLLPVKPEHHYNVLDRFHVTDLWPEFVTGQNKLVKIFMVRLEKIDLDSRSWWTPKDSTGHEAGEFKPGQFTCSSSTCDACEKESKEIYKQGWTCLNGDCNRFFQFPSHIDVTGLEYNQYFMRERTPFPGPQPKDGLVPALPRIKGNDSGSEKEYKDGIVCPKCHCCSRRIQWNYWYCENRECDFKHTIVVRMNSLEKITEENAKAMTRRRNYKYRSGDRPAVIPLHFPLVIEGHRFTVFFLANAEGRIIGSVIRIRPTRQARGRPGGYNDVYTEVQNSNIPLERRGARNAGCYIEELTSHAAVNYGAVYKYNVVVDRTIPYDEAPPIIIDIHKRLTWAAEQAIKTSVELMEEHELDVVEGAIPTSSPKFNEQLVLGYFEKSKISAHDDGEKELGPTVASVSLGSISYMKFFPKKRSGIGYEKAAVLSLLLKHGDMMVMHGALIQKNYNHSVDALGKHRFAMTCRYIRPETIADAEQRRRAVENGTLPEEWDDVQYNGARDRFESIATGEEVLRPGST